MRVLLVSNTYPPADLSGVGTLVKELAYRLGLGGHFVTVLTRRPPRDDAHGVPVRGPKLLFPLLVALRFALSPRTPWDLVQVHESDGALVAVVLRLLRAFGVRAGQARLVATLQVSYVEERRAVRPILADGAVVSGLSHAHARELQAARRDGHYRAVADRLSRIYQLAIGLHAERLPRSVQRSGRRIGIG